MTTDRRLAAGVVTIVAAVIAGSALGASLRAQTPAPAVDYARDVRPILESRCYECHGTKKTRGRLRLDVKSAALKGGMTGPAVIPGNADDSLMIRRVLGLDGEDRMPLDKDALPADQIATLRQWIAKGAPWPDDPAGTSAAVTLAPEDAPQHWAYRRPVRPMPPAVAHTAWPKNPIDQFVLARLEKEGLTPSPEASKEALIRRVSLDLTGLPPTLAEIDAFVADSRPDAYEQLVDRLLASPHYGERWARPWLDLARYADSNGYEKDNLRTMWEYRDWLIKALNADMPFDEFTIEQLAGDMLPNATRDQLIATGFNRNTLLNQEGGIDVEEARWETLIDRVNTTGTVWLGTTIACAQCHNHKYDPFSQRDFYRMVAFYDNGQYSVYGQPGGDHWIQEASLDITTPDQEVKRSKFVAELKDLNAQLTDPSPDLDLAQSAWEKDMAQTATQWAAIKPSAAHADKATLTVRDDGSVLASGVHAGVDRYVLDLSLPDGSAITGVRLEALPDASLPKGGPGRDYYGNFVLTGFHLTLNSGHDDAPVTFSDAASDDQNGGDVKDLLKPPERTYARDVAPGWSIDATRDVTRLPRQAVFVPAAPIAATAGTRARLTLAFDGGAVGQALGCFRLSITTATTPLKAVSIRAKTRALLAVPEATRTEDDQKRIRTEYRAAADSLKPTRDRIEALNKQLEQLGIVPALVMSERPTFDRPSTFFHERGAYLSPGERVYAATPGVLPPMAEDQMPNRLGLARWLVSPANPLTARVTANRAWEQFFGRGIVETSEDFGTQGSPPSHPELLDWLATEFVHLKWSQKALHRLIVTSATYRQDANASEALIEKDPYNRLFARGPRFRMEAEMIRDVALSAGGLLSGKIGGPSVFPLQPDGIWDNPYSDAKWVTSDGEDKYRRGLYTFIRRTSPYPAFLTFDATSREFCTVRRIRTNTPLQALTLLNDEAFFEAARALAGRTMSEVPATAGLDGSALERARAAHAFRLCTSRTPTDFETARIVRSYAAQLGHYRARPMDAAKVLKEERAIGKAGAAQAERAAWTLVANALLNLDETVTK
jgi:hypothetical protein